MKNKKLSVYLFVLLFSVFFPFQIVFAQGTQESLRYVCLASTRCDLTADKCRGVKVPVHAARLESKGGLPTKPVHIVECVALKGGSGTLNSAQACTTGSDSLDRTFFKTPAGAKTPYQTILDANIGYKYDGLFQDVEGLPVGSNPTQGSFTGSYIWSDHTEDGHMRNWRAMFYQDPSEAPIGEAGGEQLGTIDFDTLEKTCTKIAWDPYGRVFDSQTLEPITNASVTLSVKKGDTFVFFNPLLPENQPNTVVNPQITKRDGQFNFIVPDGEYKLSVANMLPGLDTVHPNFEKAYFEVYPAQTGEIIVQSGKIQHRDIAVTFQNTNTVPQLMESFYEAAGTSVVLTGRVSHPLSMIYAKTSKVSTADPLSKTPYRVVGNTSADKWGNFELVVDQSLLETTTEYTELFSDVDIVKVDLRTIQEVPTSKITISFEPIPTYLKGKAYTSGGVVMPPNTTVGAYISFSNVPSGTATVGTDGTFTLGSEKLPSMPYELRYTAPNGTVVKTNPSVFLAQNQTYMDENKINPYDERKTDGTKIVVKKPSSSSSSVQTGGGSIGTTTQKSGWFGLGGGQSNTPSPTTGSNTTSPLVMMVVVLVILIGAVGAGIFLYMKQKNGSSTSKWE